MLRKEFNEVLKQSLYLIVLVIGLPVFVAILSLLFGWSVTYDEVFFMTYQGGLIIFGLITGVTLFASERKQRGVEYLLTLPVSRLRLLAIKIFPRLAVLLVLSLLYVLCKFFIGGPFSEVPLFYLFYAVFMLFIISVSISASHENFVLLAIGTLFVFTAHSLLISLVFPRAIMEIFPSFLLLREGSVLVLGILGLLIPFLTSFIVSFRKFDVHPLKRFNKKYLKVFTPLVVIGLLLSLVFLYGISESGYTVYYLTGNHKLLEEDWYSTTIHDAESGSVTTFDARFALFSTSIEARGYLYSLASSYPNRDRRYIRLNLTDNTVETIYDVKHLPPYHSRGFRLFKNMLAFFEGSYVNANTTLVLVDVDTITNTEPMVKKIKLHEKLPGKYIALRLFGADESEGKRFWLLAFENARRFPVYRLWEDGDIQKIGMTLPNPYYVNGMLITREKQGMVFSRLTPGGKETIKTVPEGKRIHLRIREYGGLVLDNSPKKEMYGIRYRTDRDGTHSLLWLDLENLEITKVLDSPGFLFNFGPDGCYLLDNPRCPGKFYRIQKDGTLTLLRTFSGFDRTKKGNIFWYNRNGIIVKEKGKISVYAFPDLKELTFSTL
jgi:ABC-type transport system involved in multi-copper enzyme maturation permease subunit